VRRPFVTIIRSDEEEPAMSARILGYGVIALTALMLTQAQLAWAQSNDMPDPPPPPRPAKLSDAESDSKLLVDLEKERALGVAGKGAVLVDAVGPPMCRSLLMIIARRVDGKLTGGSYATTAKDNSSYQVFTMLPAGEHFIATLNCGLLTQSIKFNGPHAKFQVRAGEAVNVGTLHYDHKSEGILGLTGTSNRSVGPANAERIAKLKARFPKVMAKVVSRPMTIIGSAGAKTKQKTIWD
jgi:hypothetical protein